MPVTKQGPASITVTRSTRPSSGLKTCVMPIFRPRSPAIALHQLDLDVAPRREVIEPLQRVDRLRRWLQDVDEPLVRADLEVLPRVLVLERRADHAVDVLLGGKRDGPGHRRAGAHGRLDDLLGVHRDRLDHLDGHLDVVARHDHLRALGEVRHPGHVGRPEVELRPVAVEERGVTATLLLPQAVHLGLELRVRGDRARLAEDLPALDVLTADATEEAADVVARLALVEDLAEHLDPGHDGVAGLLVDADDLDRVAGVHDALLDAAGCDGAAAGDREDVLDRHQEGAVERALGLRDVGVQVPGELDDLLDVLRVSIERLERRPEDERDVVARELVLGEQLADLDLDELEELLVVDHVDLVEEDHDVRDTDLAGEQDVLARLGHGAVGRRDDQDRAVHLRGAGDHVLDVVRVARAVDVRVVALVGLVLHVRRRDRDTALALLGSVVDLLEAHRLADVLLGEHLRDGRGERGLAVVDMADGADVDVRLVALELRLSHSELPLSQSLPRPQKAELAKHTPYAPSLRPGPDGLAGAVLDDLLGDVRGHLVVAVELHRVRGPPLGRGT